LAIASGSMMRLGASPPEKAESRCNIGTNICRRHAAEIATGHDHEIWVESSSP
jgi:hypothetical protein